MCISSQQRAHHSHATRIVPCRAHGPRRSCSQRCAQTLSCFSCNADLTDKGLAHRVLCVQIEVSYGRFCQRPSPLILLNPSSHRSPHRLGPRICTSSPASSLRLVLAASIRHVVCLLAVFYSSQLTSSLPSWLVLMSRALISCSRVLILFHVCPVCCVPDMSPRQLLSLVYMYGFGLRRSGIRRALADV